jgi:hypothetical protein
MTKNKFMSSRLDHWMKMYNYDNTFYSAAVSDMKLDVEAAEAAGVKWDKEIPENYNEVDKEVICG